jgi:hypothetical protein
LNEEPTQNLAEKRDLSQNVAVVAAVVVAVVVAEAIVVVDVAAVAAGQ